MDNKEKKKGRAFFPHAAASSSRRRRPFVLFFPDLSLSAHEGARLDPSHRGGFFAAAVDSGLLLDVRLPAAVPFSGRLLSAADPFCEPAMLFCWSAGHGCFCQEADVSGDLGCIEVDFLWHKAEKRS